MMLLMPWIYRRFTLKTILITGLLTWVNALSAAGVRQRRRTCASVLPGNPAPRHLLRLLLHDGQLYTDQEAPAHLRGTAQGFIQFLTYGVGMFLGSLLPGWPVDAFSTGSGERYAKLAGLLDYVGGSGHS